MVPQLSNDIFTLLELVRANASQNPATKLNEEETISQMAAFTLAGHETTANTITWLLYELAKNPDIQNKLRIEIQEKRAEVSTHSCTLGVCGRGGDSVLKERGVRKPGLRLGVYVPRIALEYAESVDGWRGRACGSG